MRLLIRELLLVVFGTAHYRMVKRLVRHNLSGSRCVLDVGGRQSPYTVGLNADITVLDLPTDDADGMGLSPRRAAQLHKRRNVTVKFADITEGAQSPGYDGVIMVEVIEHIDQADVAIRNVAASLKPDGIFVLTTPNGERTANTNPLHIRHYGPAQLGELLQRHFGEVAITERLQITRFYPNSWNSVVALMRQMKLGAALRQACRNWCYRLSVLDGRRVGAGTTLVAVCSKPGSGTLSAA